LLLGDARQTIQTLVEPGFQADAIFFDPFSPRRCPQLWTVEFFTWVARCLAPTGRLATYSRSAAVRSALLATGLSIGTIPLSDRPLPHEWSQGTIASWDGRSLHPLRDPQLTDTAAQIHARHQQEQQHATCESTSSWRRRWGIE
jgi:tRNA U34 5-methylaminomethyl-2-thiouridine-forming methyltransferase MnmC